VLRTENLVGYLRATCTSHRALYSKQWSQKYIDPASGGSCR
jgi:hypothetical protein